MSKKKKKNTDAKKNKLEKETQELKEELKTKTDKLLRSIADFQNYQKRMEKELKQIRYDTKKKYLEELVDIYELLNKAIEDKNPKQGLKLIINNLKSFFDKENVKVIDCLGEKFDHNIHHAVTCVKKDNCEDDIIVEEVKKGYMINDKLLRPSQVIVNKKEDNEKK